MIEHQLQVAKQELLRDFEKEYKRDATESEKALLDVIAQAVVGVTFSCMERIGELEARLDAIEHKLPVELEARLDAIEQKLP